MKNQQVKNEENEDFLRRLDLLQLKLGIKKAEACELLPISEGQLSAIRKGKAVSEKFWDRLKAAEVSAGINPYSRVVTEIVKAREQAEKISPKDKDLQAAVFDGLLAQGTLRSAWAKMAKELNAVADDLLAQSDALLRREKDIRELAARYGEWAEVSSNDTSDEPAEPYFVEIVPIDTPKKRKAAE